MILEPSEELQIIYDRAMEIANSYNHEYLTLEHLVLAIVKDEKFATFLDSFPGDLNYVKINFQFDAGFDIYGN